MSTDLCFKYVVIGESNTGKTSIVQMLVENVFDKKLASTVGVEFKTYTIQLNDELVKLNIWDTAGQERFRSISKSYFRNALGAILVFALDDEESFNNLATWINDIHTLCVPNAGILLVGNKSDLESTRKITSEDAEEFARMHNMDYIETSALNGNNVELAFYRLTNTVYQKIKSGGITGNFHLVSKPIAPITVVPRKEEKKGCC